MALVFNPFTGTFDFTGAGGADMGQFLLLAGRPGTTNNPIISSTADGSIYGSSISTHGLSLFGNSSDASGGFLRLVGATVSLPKGALTWVNATSFTTVMKISDGQGFFGLYTWPLTQGTDFMTLHTDNTGQWSWSLVNHHTDVDNFTANDDHTQYLHLTGRAGTANDPILSTGGSGTIYGSSTVGGELVLFANTTPGTGGQISLLPNLGDDNGIVQIFSSDLYLNSGNVPHQFYFFSNSSRSTRLRAATGMVADVSSILPPGQGANHTTLHNDGTGQWSWSLIDPVTDFIRPLSTGFPGVDGEDGQDSFVPGPMGIMGLPGPQGLQGIPGVGIDGEDGMDAHIPGPQGLQGIPGPAGLQGIPGIGLDGMDGEDSYFPGQRGATGSTGSTGAQGPQGNFGFDGEDGRDSDIPGPRGAPGLNGAQGLQGIPGIGLDGEDGRDSDIPGPIGSQGPPGLNGKDGINGPPGVDGEGGSDDSGIIQIIQGSRIVFTLPVTVDPESTEARINTGNLAGVTRVSDVTAWVYGDSGALNLSPQGDLLDRVIVNAYPQVDGSVDLELHAADFETDGPLKGVYNVAFVAN